MFHRYYHTFAALQQRVVPTYKPQIQDEDTLFSSCRDYLEETGHLAVAIHIYCAQRPSGSQRCRQIH